MREVLERCREAGALEVHARLFARAWLSGAELSAAGLAALPGGRHLPLPRSFAAELPALASFLEERARVVSEHPSEDGSRRLLVALQGGSSVESVLLARGASCVSTQVGCAVGCRFCKTGEGGLARQLRSGEILAQVVLGRRRQAVRRVVLMGMGEPAHNLEAVLEAISWLGREGGIGHKEIVFSTVGERRALERLAAHDVKPALALSLHASDPALRALLLPRAPRIPPAELVELAEGYARAVGHPVQYQWTLLEGVNDGEGEIDGLIELLRGRHGIANMIPCNEVEGLPYRRPPIERSVAIVRRLKRAGIRATLRRSGGQDVDGACGQLRARSVGAAFGSFGARLVFLG